MQFQRKLLGCFLLGAWLSTGSLLAQQNAVLLAQQGLIEARQQHYATAIDLYKQALTFDADLPGLRMNLGLAYFKNAQFPDSIKVFKIEKKLHPDDVRLTTLLGMAHYGMGDYLVANPYLQQAAAKDPQNLALRLTLAHSCLWSKQYDCVMATYKEILTLDAQSVEADMLAGEALDAMGDAAGAMAQFRAALKVNPQEPNLHYFLGYILWTQNNYQDAAPEFQLELNRDPGHAESRAYLGDCYLQSGDYDKAKLELDKAVVSAPSSSMAHRDLGAVLAQAGQSKQAERELRNAIDLDPSDVAPHWRLARLLQSAGRKDDAAKEFAIASGMVQQTNKALTERISGASVER